MSKKWYAIEWGDSKLVTLIAAENKEDAISVFKAGLKDECRDDPDLITEVTEL